MGLSELLDGFVDSFFDMVGQMDQVQSSEVGLSGEETIFVGKDCIAVFASTDAEMRMEWFMDLNGQFIVPMLGFVIYRADEPSGVIKGIIDSVLVEVPKLYVVGEE
jgi:hypothetical protein